MSKMYPKRAEQLTAMVDNFGAIVSFDLGILNSFGDSISDNSRLYFDDIVNRAKELGRHCLAIPNESIPMPLARVLAGISGAISGRLGAIRNDMQTTLPANRDSFVQGAADEIANSLYRLELFEAYDVATRQLKRTDESVLANLEEIGKQRIDEFLKQASEQRLKAEQSLAEINVALSNARDTEKKTEALYNSVQTLGQHAVVAVEANHFMKESETHQQAAKLWLDGVIGLGIVSVGLAVFMFVLTPPPADKGVAILLHYLSSRLAAFSILMFGLSWCSRNYKSHRHNSILNKHRALALTTFQVFATSTKDPNTREEMLRLAAQTIFTPQASGYLVSDAEPAPQNTIVEVLRKVSEGKQ